MSSGPGSELQRGAVRGVGALTLRTLAVQIATVGGTVALARLLTPADYGIAAVAIACQQFGYTVMELGLPAAFIRRDEPFIPAEQRALTGVTLALAVGLVALAALAAFALLPALGVHNHVAVLVLLSLLALPPYALRLAPTILLERRLSYGRIAIIEAAQSVVFYACAIPGAAAGLGAYALVGALPVAVLAGFLAAGLLAGWDRGIAWEPGRIRPYAGFGARTGGALLIGLGQEVAFVATLAAAGGQALAGFYTIAERVMTLPTALSLAVQRVALPSLARGAEGDVRAGRAGSASVLVAVALGLPVALTAGIARPLVVIVFGRRWLPGADVVLAASAGALAAGSVGAVLQGLALADGRGGAVLRAAVLQCLVALSGAALVVGTSAGALGVGIAASMASLVFAVSMLRSSAQAARAGITGLARVLAVVIGATLAGRAAGSGLGLRSLVLGGGVGLGVWLALSWILCRRELILLMALLRGALAPGAAPRAATRAH